MTHMAYNIHHVYLNMFSSNHYCFTKLNKVQNFKMNKFALQLNQSY